MTRHPHRIDPIVKDERRTSRNCLRVDYISDGIEPRCNLRPLDEQGQWVLDNRPYHLREMITLFDYCISDQGCNHCRVWRKAGRPGFPFHSTAIRVYRERNGMVVRTLGQCTWYDLYTGSDINDAAAWVKRHMGALGATKTDAWGRYREGFINGWLLPEGIRPPWFDGKQTQ